MGSPVSAVVANLYMDLFEELALWSAPVKQYVDDTCCIVKRGMAEELLDHLNSVRPSIQFTLELEREGALPFELQKTRKGVFLDKQNIQTTAYVESRLLDSPTIRHGQCQLVIRNENSHCHECSNYRRCLNIMVTRLQHAADKENRTVPSSKVNYCHLSTPEKKERLSRLHSMQQSANRHRARLEAWLEEAAATAGVTLDVETHSDIQQIMTDNSPVILDRYPPDSFGRIFGSSR